MQTSGGELIKSRIGRELLARYAPEAEFLHSAPDWTSAIEAWRREAAPDATFAACVLSGDHEAAFERAGGGAAQLTRQHTGIEEIAALADALNLRVCAALPYGALIGRAGVMRFLEGTSAGGPYWERVLEWVALDSRTSDFIVFLERELIARLGSVASGQLLIILENRPDRNANAAWLERSRELNVRLVRGLSAKTFDAGFEPETIQAELDRHLQFEQNLILLHRIHRVLLCRPWKVTLADFLSAGACVKLERLYELAQTDEDVRAMVRTWHRHPSFAPHLEFRGVPLGEALEYDTMIDILVAGLRCFPLARLGNLAQRL